MKRSVPLVLGFAAANGRNTLTIAGVESAEKIAVDEAFKRPIGFMPPWDGKSAIGL